MDTLVPDEWLRQYLKTKASASILAEKLSLCGPSVEKTLQTPQGIVYLVEVTPNRVDSASIYGIAREANAILNRFEIKSSLVDIKHDKPNFSNKVSYLNAIVDPKLCPRFSAVLIRNVQIEASPKWMVERLTAVGVRSINNVVDISNYLMFELGQPVHTFDYDKIENHKMILRESRKGERITTLDEKSHTLPGRDIVIEDGSKRLIDLAGIMGGANSAVDNNTKNVLLFVQTYNPANIRRTSMTLSHRTDAAVLFEKGIDPQLVETSICEGIKLFKELTHGEAESQILNLYPKPYRKRVVTLEKKSISTKIGVEIKDMLINKYLSFLGFNPRWNGNKLVIEVPSYRARDVSSTEDVIEEIARLHGYFNLPSNLMGGIIPDRPSKSSFTLEDKVKDTLKDLGGVEVYTLSLVSKEQAGPKSIRLSNPLGQETEYLRTSMIPSMIDAAKVNSVAIDPFHLFEISNIYIPKNADLPNEKLILSGIFSQYKYREAKGIIEALIEKLNINAEFEIEDKIGFIPSTRLKIKIGSIYLGAFGELEHLKLLYYEFDIDRLNLYAKDFARYLPIPTFPPQIEDTTLVLPEKTKVGDLISQIKKEKYVSEVTLKDIFNDSYTFRIKYQNPNKTLDNKEVKKLRGELITRLQSKFGVKEK